MAFVTQTGEPGSWHVRDLGCLGCPKLALGHYQERSHRPAVGLACCVTRAYNEAGCPPAAERSEELAEQRRRWGYAIAAEEKKVPLYVIDDAKLGKHHDPFEVMANIRALADLLDRTKAEPLTSKEVARALGVTKEVSTLPAQRAGFVEKVRTRQSSKGWVLTALGRKRLLGDGSEDVSDRPLGQGHGGVSVA